MRSALTIALLLCACVAEPREPTYCFPPPGVEKVDLYGTWSHRAIVIASDTPSVAVGDETTSEVEITLEEEFLIAYAPGHEPWLALRIDHFDVVGCTLSSGERVTALESATRPWWQRELARIDISEDLIGASVPTDAELEPGPFDFEYAYGVTYHPRREDDGRLVWSFFGAYWVTGSPAGEILVRHELERIEP